MVDKGIVAVAIIGGVAVGFIIGYIIWYCLFYRKINKTAFSSGTRKFYFKKPTVYV